MFRLNRNKQMTHPNSLKESIFGHFSENFGLFRFVSVCYETDLFVSVVLIQVRNTETNRNFQFFVSGNKPKQTRNRSCFGLPKLIFICFEDTLDPCLLSAPNTPPPFHRRSADYSQTHSDNFAILGNFLICIGLHLHPCFRCTSLFLPDMPSWKSSSSICPRNLAASTFWFLVCLAG